MGLLHFLSWQNNTLEFLNNNINLTELYNNLNFFNYEQNWLFLNFFLTICFPVLFSVSENSISYDLYWSLVSDVHCVFDSFFPSLKIWYYNDFTLFSWDYLHQSYLKRALNLSIIVDELYRLSIVDKYVTISMPFNIFIFLFSIRLWNLVCILALIYFITNKLLYKFQISMNIYLIYYDLIVESEKEMSSFDDYYWFLLLFLNMFGWYFLLVLLIYIFNFNSVSWIIFACVFTIICILGLPMNAFLSYGIFFSAYIRGSAASINLISETVFDVIGVIVVFSRFLIQNIRFVLVFMAFFELFEWVYSGDEVAYMKLELLDLRDSLSELCLSQNYHLFFVICCFKLVALYLYYALHLIILIFMQIGIYFILSFWLFFFLYTSFIKLTTDYYFIKKFNICYKKRHRYFIFLKPFIFYLDFWNSW